MAYVFIIEETDEVHYMGENIAFGFLGLGFPDSMTVFIVSMLPLLGLRAGVVLSFFMGFGVVRTLVVCMLGALAPAPFILILFDKMLWKLERKRGFSSTLRRIKRILRGRRSSGERLFFALFVFAALPLPFTSVWISGIAAAMLGLDFRTSMLAIGAGTFASTILMMIFVFAFPGLFW